MLTSRKLLSSPGRESRGLLSEATFVGLLLGCLLTTLFKGATRRKVEAERAIFGVIKRYHHPFFSARRPQLTQLIRAVKARAQGAVGNGLALLWSDLSSQL